MPDVREDPGSEVLREFSCGLCCFRCCRFPAMEAVMECRGIRVAVVGERCWMTSQRPQLAEDPAVSGFEVPKSVP